MVYFRKHLFYVKYCETCKNPVSGHPFYYQKYYMKTPNLFLVILYCIENKHGYPADIHLFIFNNKNSTRRCEICLKLTIKTPERRYWLRSGVYIATFEHISYPFPVFLLLHWTSKC